MTKYHLTVAAALVGTFTTLMAGQASAGGLTALNSVRVVTPTIRVTPVTPKLQVMTPKLNSWKINPLGTCKGSAIDDGKDSV